MYDIVLAGQKAGTAQVTKQGLYWHISCRCSLEGDIIHRLYVCCGADVVDLGIPVPEGDCFCLRRSIPAKKLGAGEPEFYLAPGKVVRQGKFVPLSPEEPFRYLRRLEDVFLQRRGEQLGVIVPQR